jgi:hypothetical protein
MKTAVSSTLTTFLNNLCTQVPGTPCNYGIIDLYTFILQNGTTLRWAAWPIAVGPFPSTGIYGGSSVGGNTRASGQTYAAVGPYVSRSKITQGLKLEVSQFKMTIAANPNMQIGSTPVLAAIAQGQFNGAQVWVDRLFAQTIQPNGFDYTLGTVNWFTGFVAEVEECGRAHAVLSVKDPLSLLSTDYPRNLYLSGCRHLFGDSGCTFNKSASPVTASGTVQSGSTTVTIKTNLTTGGVIPAPAATPSYAIIGGNVDVNLPDENYYVMLTFTGANGESLPSPELTVFVGGGGVNGTTNKLLKVLAPGSPPSGASGWNIYVGLGSGQEQLQASFTGFTSGSAYWLQSGLLFENGAPPPVTPSQGYYAQGTITFTSGANNGQQQTITAYDLVGGLGQITICPPLLTPPSAGDTFTVVADCDHTIAVCQFRYNNLIHFAGAPWIPLPEQSI